MALDTSVASLFLGAHADATGYADIVRGHRLALPMVAFAELRQGSLINGWGEVRRQELARFLAPITLLPITETTAEQWASLRFECRRRGIAASENDAWVAATALSLDSVLVSHDRDHLRMRAAVPRLQVLSLLKP